MSAEKRGDSTRYENFFQVLQAKLFDMLLDCSSTIGDSVNKSKLPVKLEFCELEQLAMSPCVVRGFHTLATPA